MHLRFTVISAIVIFIIILGLFSCKGLGMQKDMPFQEIIPLDRSIAVVNAGNWFPKNLKLILSDEDGHKQIKYYDDNQVCLFKDLTNGQQYTVTIKRNDLKGMLLYRKLKAEVSPRTKGSKYIILVGASVGKSWEFPKLNNRVEIGEDIVLGNRTIYDFDKSQAIDSINSLTIPVTAVIIKECSAYFPRDLQPSIIRIKEWVAEVRAKGIMPVLATVVPVTKEHDKTHPDRFKSILEVNDSIRNYANEDKIMVLDLEKAVRVSDSDRHLRNEYAQPDGNHLVRKAYDEALDLIAVKLIKQITN